MDPDELAQLNALYEKWRRAILGWTNLATCVKSALDKLADGKQTVAYRILTAALAEHSPPDA